MVLTAVFLEDPSQWVSIEVSGKTPVRIGRLPDAVDGEEILRIPWRDRIISRNHSIAILQDDVLLVERLGGRDGKSRPNRFYSNAPHEERVPLDDPLALESGESFSIGFNGRTAFFLLETADQLPEVLAQQKPFGGWPVSNTPELTRDQRAGSDPSHFDHLDEYSLRFQLKLLQRELPEKVLAGWNTENDLFTRTADFLKTALPGQARVSAAFLAVEEDMGSFEILNTDPSSQADFRVSASLMKEINLDAPSPEEVYVWTSEHLKAANVSESSILHRTDWVIAIPVASHGEDAHIYRGPRGLLTYLYVTASQSHHTSPSAYVPFLRLIASLIASLLASRERQRIQDQLSAHFSPALRRMLEEGKADQLKPVLTECTVLFCDRRGASRIIEAATDDEEILALLRDNQDIVGELSHTVFEHDGVITDFAGDGILALWGWPVEVEDHALRAARTAESIAERFASRVEMSPKGLLEAPVRMGISTGRIAVGNTGPVQQVHISVFGSPVNFGARLEALGKQFQVPALLSETTCNLMRDSGYTVRRLCYIRPAGFKRSYPIYELVLPKAVGGTGATPDQIAAYEKALEFFLQRQWDDAIDILRSLPEDDGPAHWLEHQAHHFWKHEPGEKWQGEIASEVK